MTGIQWELGSTDNESTATWFIKLFVRWSTYVNLKSHGNKILSFVASLSRNHYCTTAGWDCLEINFLRFVRIDVCKIKFHLFWNSNSICNGFSWISTKHHEKRFFSRGFFHLGNPLQILPFLRLFFSVAPSAPQVGFFIIGLGRVGKWTKFSGSRSGSGQVGVSKYTIGYFQVFFTWR